MRSFDQEETTRQTSVDDGVCLIKQDEHRTGFVKIRQIEFQDTRMLLCQMA
jgi:hypothetical protein